jgi:hypothetical protein
MDRTISAPATPLLKFLLAPAWILGFGWGTYTLWVHPETVEFNGVKGGATRGDQWTFLVALVVGTVMLLYHTLPLKRAILTPTGLRVSNYREEVFIPFTDIQAVTQGRWLRARAVTVHLRTESALGDTITFMPSTRSRLAFWREDEIVAELRSLAHIAPEALSS